MRAISGSSGRSDALITSCRLPDRPPARSRIAYESPPSVALRRRSSRARQASHRGDQGLPVAEARPRDGSPLPSPARIQDFSSDCPRSARIPSPRPSSSTLLPMTNDRQDHPRALRERPDRFRIQSDHDDAYRLFLQPGLAGPIPSARTFARWRGATAPRYATFPAISAMSSALSGGIAAAAALGPSPGLPALSRSALARLSRLKLTLQPILPDLALSCPPAPSSPRESGLLRRHAHHIASCRRLGLGIATIADRANRRPIQHRRRLSGLDGAALIAGRAAGDGTGAAYAPTHMKRSTRQVFGAPSWI